MIYRTFTDAELRRAIDNDPLCGGALAEAAARFCGKTHDEIAEEEFERGYAMGKDDGYTEGLADQD